MDRNTPGCRYRQTGQQRNPRHCQKSFPPLFPNQERCDHDRRNRQSNKPLGQKCQSGKNPGGSQHDHPGKIPFFRQTRRQKGQQTSRHKQSNLCIQYRTVAQSKYQSKIQIQDPAHHCNSVIPGVAPQEQRQQQSRQPGRQCRRKTQGKIVISENFETQCRQLVAQCRFLKIIHSCQPGDHPVAGFNHFPGDFRITELVRRNHRPEPQRGHIHPEK